MRENQFKPRRVGRREARAHVATRIEEVCAPLCLAAVDVVADHMELPASGLVGDDVDQEGQELFAGVACCRFAQHLSGGSVACREHTKRAVAPVLEAVALGIPPRQRQHLVLAVEGMDHVFSSRQNIMACANGFTCSLITSATLASKSG